MVDKDGKAQDTFNLEEDSMEILDLMPEQVIGIFRQLVSEYRKDTSIEGISSQSKKHVLTSPLRYP